MALYKRDHYIGVSRSSLVGGTPTEKFFLRNAGGTDYLRSPVLAADNESGRTGYHALSEQAPVASDLGWTKELELFGDNHSLTFFGMKAGTGATVATETAGGTTVYRHVSSGPEALVPATVGATLVRSIGKLEDIGDPSNNNAQLNRSATAVPVERTEIVCVRDAPTIINVSLRGMQTHAALGTTPTAVTNYRSKIFGSGMTYVYTSTALAAATANFANVGVTAPSAAASAVGSSAVDMGALGVEEVRVRLINTLDLDSTRDDARSVMQQHATGSVGGWVRESQQLEIEFLIDMTMHNTGALAGIADDLWTNTRRGFEIWLHHATNIAASGTAFAAWRITAPVCYMHEGPTTESSGQGKQMLRLRYRAAYDTVNSIGWRMEGSILNQSTVYN